MMVERDEELDVVEADSATSHPDQTDEPLGLVDRILWLGIAVAVVGVIVVGFLTLRAVTSDDTSSRTTAEMLLDRGMRAVASDPASGTAHIDLGSAYFETGDYERAISEFEIAQQYPETELYATYNLAHAYRLADDHERAAEAFDAVLGMKPPAGTSVLGQVYRDARYWLAVERMALGQPQRAIDAAETLLEHEPLDAEAANVVASAYAELGDTEKARELYERVLAVQPGDPTAQAGLESLPQ